MGDHLTGDIMRGVAGDVDDEADKVVGLAAVLRWDAGVLRLLALLALLRGDGSTPLDAEIGAAIPSGG